MSIRLKTKQMAVKNPSTGQYDEFDAFGGIYTGSDGTSYNDLANKPSINNVTLTGNKTLADIGAASASDVSTKLTAPNTPGTAGQVLTSNGNGGQSWQTPSSGGGTTDYTALTNKPQIAGVTLSGNKTLSDLGIPSQADVSAKYTKPASGIPASDLASGVIPNINGKLNAPSTAGAAGQVLTSDGNGGQSWQTPSSGGSGAVNNWLKSINANILYETTHTQTSSQDTVWLEHVAVAPEDDVYAIIYQADGVESDIRYFARVVANCSDESNYNAVRVTALNTPFVVPKRNGKQIVDFSIVLNRSDGSANEGTVTSTCTWGIVLFCSRKSTEDNALQIINNANVVFNLASAVEGTDDTIWFESFVDVSVYTFDIQILSVSGRYGTPSRYGRIVAEYTDETADVFYLETLNQPIHVSANVSKTLAKWYLCLNVSSDETVTTASKWRIIAWTNSGATSSESTKSIISRIMNNLEVLNVSGAFYGPVSREYVAQTTTEKWQSLATAKIENISPSGYKYVYVIFGQRHGLGKRIGVVLFTDEDGEYVGEGRDIFDYEPFPGGSCVQRFVIPDGTVHIEVDFEGIANTKSDEHSVIGELYYVKDCCVMLTDTDIEDKREPLNTQWKNAINTIRSQQGTSLCFGIQTDTHYTTEFPRQVGKRLPRMTQFVGFDFIANLGDITRGYEDSPDQMREYARDIMQQYTDNTRCPFLLAIGNHEKNVLYQEQIDSNAPLFTQAELYAMYTKQALNTGNNIGTVPGKSYYYVDLPEVRVIVLFTNDSETFAFTMSSAQNSWLTNTALNTQKPVLVLSHVPLLEGMDEAHSSTYDTAIASLKSFINNGGTVIACISGHTHSQTSSKSDGIWHITCLDSYKLRGTTAEFFMVDMSTYNISTIGVGEAESRTFTH